MDKNKLLTFLDKYNLGGSVESVKLIANGKTLKTIFVTEDKTLAGSVTLTSCDIEKSELPIFETAKLKTMIKILSDTITVTLQKVDDRPIGILISDGVDQSNVVLADSSVIPKAPTVKEPENFEVEIPIDSDFVDRFVKAKNALPDVDSFTLMMNENGTDLKLVVGYSSINSNRVTLGIKTTPGKNKLVKPLSFNANYFKEILLKNQEASGAVFKVSSIGIAVISFIIPDYEANYYLIKKEMES